VNLRRHHCPLKGAGGLVVGNDRQEEGEFFRAEITGAVFS